jgi:hypothetical protein
LSISQFDPEQTSRCFDTVRQVLSSLGHACSTSDSGTILAPAIRRPSEAAVTDKQGKAAPGH